MCAFMTWSSLSLCATNVMSSERHPSISRITSLRPCRSMMHIRRMAAMSCPIVLRSMGSDISRWRVEFLNPSPLITESLNIFSRRFVCKKKRLNARREIGFRVFSTNDGQDHHQEALPATECRPSQEDRKANSANQGAPRQTQRGGQRGG